MTLRRAIVQELESYASAGVTEVRKGRRRAKSSQPSTPAKAAPATIATTTGRAAASPKTTAPPRPAPAATSSAPSASLFDAQAAWANEPLDRGQRVAALEVLQQQVAGCTRCRELADTRTQTVFGVGNPQPRLVFLGEAPGADEDRLGEPFVGRAGQLLTKIIEACTLRREDVYILNVLKCRPPGNRTPTDEEAAHCWPYLEQQLAILRPEFICCLGAVAVRRLLSVTTAVGRLRGQFFTYQGSQVLVTYHPSYLLRNPPAKKDVWEDMKLLMARMGIELGARDKG
ncbi:MAG: uracil-DNA glycosylase [Pirellulales bacterium]|nr:uracil-DNA glycosylase [Pirellulales bacterium]